MRRQRKDTEYVEFVDARRAACVRTAYLLCGDWHRAEERHAGLRRPVPADVARVELTFPTGA